MTKKTVKINADVEAKHIRCLAASVCIRALKDLESADLLTSLDALLWLTGSDFPTWAEAAGIPLADPLKLLSNGYSIPRLEKRKEKSRHEQ